LFHTKDTPAPQFTDTLELDLGNVEPSLAGPKRPQDRIALSGVKSVYEKSVVEMMEKGPDVEARTKNKVPVEYQGNKFELGHGAVVIAAITSCTNTSNPAVMLGAGLVAQKAHEKGLKVKPWVKTSLAPGSRVVTEYLKESGLMTHLDALGFNLVG